MDFEKTVRILLRLNPNLRSHFLYHIEVFGKLHFPQEWIMQLLLSYDLFPTVMPYPTHFRQTPRP